MRNNKRIGWRVGAVLLFIASTISSRAVWQLSWSDEFNGSTIDSSKWTFETGNNNGWGNGEREYYTGRTNNAYVSGGLLHIVVRQETTNGFPYTSARMKTQGKFSKLYGRIEFSAKLPQGLGYWPALWLLGNNITSVNWPACGEIDVLENNQSLGNQVQGTLHYSDASNNHLQQTRVYALPNGGSVTNFHTYAIEWTTNSIKWLVDSNLVQTWTSWSSSTGPYPAPYNQPFFLIMNVAVGGSYLGNPTDAQINSGTVFPGEMQVDWVRVYDDVPVAAPPSAPTGLNIGQGQAKTFVTWDASSSGATGYNIKRATTGGGPYAVVGTAATNGYADSAVSACSTYYYVISATNSFGESTNSAESSVSLGAYATAVNSGGSASAQFSADTNFAGTVSGGTQAAPVTTTIDTSAVTSPAPQDVYQTERYGNFTYTFTNLTAGLTYKLRLHFAETYWTAVGQRRFNVLVNGAQVLTNFDIIAAAGAANKANIQEFNATPSGGQITIQYVTVTDNAKSSGIELLLPPPVSPAGLTATAGDSQVVLKWNATTGVTSYDLKRSLVPSGPYAALANGLANTNYTDSAATNGATYYYVVSSVRSGCESTNSASANATPVSSVPPPVSLTLQWSGSNLSVGWPTGILQSASSLLGPWSDMGLATAPSNIVVTPVDGQQFFRVKVR
jgi:beta-glucanase (GH16 family)